MSAFPLPTLYSQIERHREGALESLDSQLMNAVEFGAIEGFTKYDPKVSLFSGQQHRRITPFATVVSEVPFQGRPTINSGQWGPGVTQIRARIGDEKNVDLLGPCFLHMHLARLSLEGYVNVNDSHVAWVNDVGYAAINTVSLKVAEVAITKTDGIALHAMSQLAPAGPGVDDGEVRGFFPEPPGPYLEIPDTARIYASTDRHVMADLQMFFGYSRQDFLPLVALKQHSIEVEIGLNPWIDLVRATDHVLARHFTDAEISANVLQGNMLGCSLVYQGIVLCAEDRQRVASLSNVSYLFKYMVREVEQTVQANAEMTQNVRIESQNASAERIFFYRRASAVGSGTAKKYFDFSTEINPAKIPSTLSTSVNGNIYWPITPFAHVEMRNNDKLFTSGPGELYHQLTSRISKQNKLPVSYVHLFSHELEPSSSKPMGCQNDSRIDNLVATFYWRAENSGGTGLREAGKLFIFTQKWGAYTVRDGMLGLKMLTV